MTFGGRQDKYAHREFCAEKATPCTTRTSPIPPLSGFLSAYSSKFKNFPHVVHSGDIWRNSPDISPADMGLACVCLRTPPPVASKFSNCCIHLVRLVCFFEVLWVGIGARSSATPYMCAIITLFLDTMGPLYSLHLRRYT